MARVALIVPPEDRRSRITGIKEHLGLDYVAATLRREKHEVLVVDATLEELDAQRTFERALSIHPDIVGMSVSIACLRSLTTILEGIVAQRVKAHVVIGGHLATFMAEAFLRKFQRIDSVCRGEGETVMAELASRLDEKRDWRGVPGLSFRRAKTIVHNPVRNAIPLDELPWPARDTLPSVLKRGGPISILSSRGCPRQCAFCSVHAFYAQHSAPWRTRSMDDVACEFVQLVETFRPTFVVFNDDNFFGDRKDAQERVRRLVKQVRATNLGPVALNISLRPDDVREDCLQPLKTIGLATVFLGVESGTESGLRDLGRSGSPNLSREAIRTLEHIEIGYQIGFILFRPRATLEEIVKDIDFLTELVDRSQLLVDVYPFDRDFRVLPGTRLAKELREEGMLYGDAFAPCFRFADPRVAALHEFARRRLDPIFRPRFAALAPRVGTPGGRRQLRALHLDHLEALRRVARLLAQQERRKLEKLAEQITRAMREDAL